jgi:hypothetical protein
VWSSLRHISSGGGVAHLAKAIGNTLHTVGPMSQTVLQHQRAENFGALGVLGSSNAVLRIKDGQYPLLGGVRINLSFRKAAA